MMNTQQGVNNTMGQRVSRTQIIDAAMQIMEDDHDIKSLLKHWGDWLRSIPAPVHGAHGVSYEERTGDNDAPLPEDAIAERVDRILCRIKSRTSDIFTVLYLYYYAGYSLEEIGSTMKKGKTVIKQWKLNGEASAAAYWDAGYGVEVREVENNV